MRTDDEDDTCILSQCRAPMMYVKENMLGDSLIELQIASCQRLLHSWFVEFKHYIKLQ